MGRLYGISSAGGGGGGFQVFERTFRSFELQALRNTHYTLLPEPPAGTGYIVDNLVFRRTAGAAAARSNNTPLARIVLARESVPGTDNFTTTTGLRNFVDSLYTFNQVNDYITDYAYGFHTSAGNHTIVRDNAIRFGRGARTQSDTYSGITGTFSIELHYRLAETPA